jgi:hypothetical protein
MAEEGIKIGENNEIEKALKEFQVQSSTVSQPQKSPKSSEVPKIVELVIKYSGGTIKGQRQAEYILLGFVVLAIITSLFLFFSVGSVKKKISTEILEKAKLMPVNTNHSN